MAELVRHVDPCIEAAELDHRVLPRADPTQMGHAGHEERVRVISLQCGQFVDREHKQVVHSFQDFEQILLDLRQLRAIFLE